MLLSRTRTRARAGSIALATSALLLMIFPLVRPFFPLDVGEPAQQLMSRPMSRCRRGLSTPRRRTRRPSCRGTRSDETTTPRKNPGAS